MKSLKWLALLPLWSLTACANPSGGIRGACAVFAPITYSQLDSPETVAQIEQHDVRWLRLCSGDSK